MNANPPKHTVQTLLSSCPKDIDRRDTEILLAHVVQKPVEFFLAHPEHTVPLLKRWRFSYLLKKRVNGFPLAYLTGHKEFFGLDFVVNKHTLVPRPETELLVECANERIMELQNSGIGDITLIDVGTGSGCIPIAINKSTKQSISKTIAIDISKSALRAAKKNAHTHGVDITLLRGNLLSSFLNRPNELGTMNKELILTANLPYLSEEQHASEPSIQHEPRTALVADENGLALYRELLEQVNSLILQFFNSSLTIFFEIDPSQSTPIQALINTILPTATVEIKKDLRGQDRVVIIKTSDLQH